MSVWQQLANEAIRGDQSAYWQTDVPAFTGGGQAAYTGMFHGAAGIGLALLALHPQLTESDPYFDLPDFPY